MTHWRASPPPLPLAEARRRDKMIRWLHTFLQLNTFQGIFKTRVCFPGGYWGVYTICCIRWQRELAALPPSGACPICCPPTSLNASSLLHFAFFHLLNIHIAQGQDPSSCSMYISLGELTHHPRMASTKASTRKTFKPLSSALFF